MDEETDAKNSTNDSQPPTVVVSSQPRVSVSVQNLSELVHSVNNQLTAISIREREQSRTINEDGDEDEDDVQRQNYEKDDPIADFLQHLIYCCDNQTGLNLYHVIAFRRHDARSRKRIISKPFKMIGYDFSFARNSLFVEKLIMTTIVGLLQMIGITVILVSEVTWYIRHAGDDAKCEYEAEDWQKDGGFIFKILTFLFAELITAYIIRNIREARHAGFNEILRTVPAMHYARLGFFDVLVIYLGLAINIYTLFCAGLGSFFLIYTSEAGSNALDIVLNAVGLFFMIELDGFLVDTFDYTQLKRVVIKASEIYTKEAKERQEASSSIAIVRTPTEREHSISPRGFKILDFVMGWFTFLLISLTIVVGIVSPFAILICW